MSRLVANLKDVRLPKVQARKREMLRKIRELVSKGYTKFLTRTVPCLNNIESPDPDDPPPEGYKHIDFWHDCHKKDVREAEYNDVILYACR